jgi:hypothetical protein
MNPGLAMGDELLKKTGSGNLFMVFGGPDIEIKPTDDGRLRRWSAARRAVSEPKHSQSRRLHLDCRFRSRSLCPGAAE